MITISFVLMSLGNHHEITRVKWPAAPRQGEWVSMPILGTSHEVHSVDWEVTADGPLVYVKLKP